MIDEALEVFRKIYDKEEEKLVVNKHIPKDGTYILVNIKSGKIIEKLNISKTEFYRNYKKRADYLRNINSQESLFKPSQF